MAKQRCPTCLRLPPTIREYPFTKSLVRILIKAYFYCDKNKVDRGMINDVIGQRNTQYSVMNKIRRFGFSPSIESLPPDLPAGTYIFHLERIKAFLHGQLAIPKAYIIDQTKDAIEMSKELIKIDQVKEYSELPEYDSFRMAYPPKEVQDPMF